MTTQTFDTARLKDAIGFSLSSKCWGNRRKADISTVQTDAEKGRMRLSKELIQAEEYSNIKSYLGDLQRWVYMRTVPSFFRKGFQLASLKAVPEIEARMKQAKVDLASLVEELIKVYPAKIDEAKVALNSQFNDADYPSADELREQFSVGWNYVSFSTPEALPPELRQAEADKLQAQMQDAGQQITAALRIAFSELIKHAVDRLQPNEDGRKKVFRDSLLEKVQEFLDTFQNRNLLGDKELENLVNKAQEVIIGISPDDLRKNDDVRSTTLAEFKKIEDTLNEFVEVQKSRVFDFAED